MFAEAWERAMIALSRVFLGPSLRALERYARGHVLDVGGRDFYRRVVGEGVSFERWTCLESDADELVELADERYECLHGDGCAMEFASDRFDTVLSFQVLEHVFEPIRMFEELARVLKPGGHAIVVVPQTADLHMAPENYQNLTRHWLEAACARTGLEVVELRALGGVWRTLASRTFLFLAHALRMPGYSQPDIRRNVAFYALFPLMLVWVALAVPIQLLFSLGDLSEEANNHLLVARKPVPGAGSPAAVGRPHG